MWTSPYEKGSTSKEYWSHRAQLLFNNAMINLQTLEAACLKRQTRSFCYLDDREIGIWLMADR